jgi:hypothetical protein
MNKHIYLIMSNFNANYGKILEILQNIKSKMSFLYFFTFYFRV